MTTATNTRVSAASSKSPSPHEREILRAIAGGAGINELLRCPKWTINDVSRTLQRHRLLATEDGRIIRRRTIADLLNLAENSASPYIRKKAAEAAEQLRELHAALDGNQDDLDDEAEKARCREALEQWIQWLREAIAEAITERRRLRPRKDRRQGVDGIAELSELETAKEETSDA